MAPSITSSTRSRSECRYHGDPIKILMNIRMKKILPLMLCLALAAIAHDSPGQTIKNFQLVNVVGNQTVSLDSYASSKGLVLIFTSNSCPYDDYYRKRIDQLAKAYQDRVPVVLVNAHAEPNESVERMVEKANLLNLTIPYLADKDQTLMTSLNVRKSPEVVLLANSSGNFSVVYRGAIDDNAQVEADVHHHYLRDAIDAMLSNQKITTPEVRPVGCNLKKKP